MRGQRSRCTLLDEYCHGEMCVCSPWRLLPHERFGHVPRLCRPAASGVSGRLAI